MRKTAVVVCVIWGLFGAGCNSKVDRALDCSTFEKSSASIGHMIGTFADALEQAESLDIGLLQMRAYLEANSSSLETCTRQLERGFQTMTPEEVAQFNEAFIVQPEVMRFLDAQDRIQNAATAEQTQELEELLSSFPFFSE